MGEKDDETNLEARVSGFGPTLRDAQDLGATIRLDPHEGGTDKEMQSELPRISLGRGSVVPPTANTDFAVVSTLGEGGMGSVHLAWQRSLARDVAVKTLKDQSSAEVGMELLREARLTGSLEHPGVIPIHALGADEHGNPLLVMKRVEGVDFANLLSDEHHPIWAERMSATVDRLEAQLEIIVQVCRTLEFAHARGVIHRDVKPANIMVGRYGEVYLVDWGIAIKKGERHGRGIAGTPGFMAPEMFLGGTIDERTDVYLLGATLHCMITGRLRHAGTDVLSMGKASIKSEPFSYDAHVPQMLAEICNRATARDPEDRPQSAHEFRERITAFLRHRSAVALSSAARARLTKLLALLDAAEPEGPPKDLGAAYRLATEARFGFAQCLTEHPSHADAIAGAREAITALVDLELRQGHADSAEAILRELDTKDDVLALRIAAVRARDEERRKEAARLEALDRDRNPTIAVMPRVVLLALSAVMVVGIGVFAGNERRGAWTEVAITVIAIGTIGCISLLLRGWLFKTAYSRKFVAVFFVFLGCWLLDKIACALTHGDPAGTFVIDLWIGASSLSVASLTIERKLWMSAVTLAIGAIVLRAYPEDTHQVFSIAMFCAVTLAAVRFWRARSA